MNLELPSPPSSFLSGHVGPLPAVSFAPTPLERITGVSGASCPLHRPMLDTVHGAATYYDPTGNLTASGLPYGSGIAIAWNLRPAYPYRTAVRLTNVLTNKTIDTIVADTGNFGVGTEYPVVDIGGKTYERVCDLPINIKNALGVVDSTIVRLERV